jgi:hypothetical protein
LVKDQRLFNAEFVTTIFLENFFDALEQLGTGLQDNPFTSSSAIDKKIERQIPSWD